MKRKRPKITTVIYTILLLIGFCAFAIIVYMGKFNEVIVHNGEGGGRYQADERVKISAKENLDGKPFGFWEVEPPNIKLEDYTAAETFFVMPEKSVVLTAHYQETWTDQNGFVYEGVRIGGYIHGWGKVTYPNGEYYEGEFRMGVRSGYGTHHAFHPNGQLYQKVEGEWKSNRPNGDITHTWYDENGVLYQKVECKYVNAVAQGTGVLEAYYTDGTLFIRYEGDIADNQRNGSGVLYDGYGRVIYDGEWLGDKMSGNGITHVYDEQDRLREKFEGTFERNHISGAGIYEWYDEKGTLVERHEGEIRNLSIVGNGIHYWYDSEGKLETIFEGEWNLSQMSGTFYWYDEEGTVVKSGSEASEHTRECREIHVIEEEDIEESDSTGEDTEENKSAGETAEEGKEKLTELVSYVTDGFLLKPNILINNIQAISLQIAANYLDGMFEVDSKGQTVEALCTSYESNEDATVWTFHLREGVKWVDYQGRELGEVTARDFVMSHSITMNYHKGHGINVNAKDIIKGGAEYYKMTEEMDEETALALTMEDFQAAVGIETPDDYTIIYHLEHPESYFWLAFLGQGYYPVAAGFVETVGVKNIFAGDLTKMWYSGPYLPVEYKEDHSLTMCQNPLYWDTECTRFETLTWRVVSDDAEAYELYERGELDYVNLPSDVLHSIYEDENHKYHDQLVETRPNRVSFSLHFNYRKLNKDGTVDENWNKAIANENFRKAFYHGTDWTTYLGIVNFINPLSCDLSTYCVNNLAFFSDGKDYTRHVKEIMEVEDIETISKYNPKAAAEYKIQSMEELKKIGVTFPIEMVYHVQTNDRDSENKGKAIKQLVEEGLGTDFVTVEIEHYTGDLEEEVISKKLQCFAVVGLGNNAPIPIEILSSINPYNPMAVFAVGWSNTAEVVQNPYDYQTDLVTKLNTFAYMYSNTYGIFDDADRRLEMTAYTEAYILEHALVMPLHTKVNWQLTHINDYTKAYSQSVAGKLKNVDAYVEPCTTDEYENWKIEAISESIGKDSI